MKGTRLASLVLVLLILAACEHSEPTALDPTGSQFRPLPRANEAATVTREDFGPVPLNFPSFVSCLGGAAFVTGSFSGWDRIVERSDGSVHITRKMDVSNVSITFDGQVWTAGPNASEIFITNFSGDLEANQQVEHLGVVVFRAEDDAPALRLVHHIQFVRLPSGELQLNRQLFAIQCVGPNA
jgi:hypothetical protein